MRLTDRIYLVGGHSFGYSDVGDCNVYMIDCGDELALVDTGDGFSVPRILENIRRMGFDPARLKVAFNTHCHCDHIGGNKTLKESTGCGIAAHEAAKREMETLGELVLYEFAVQRGHRFEPTEVDRPLRGGDRVEVGDIEFLVAHTPGHSPGGVSILAEEDGMRDLFTGDTAFPHGRLWYINGLGYDHLGLKASVKKMLALEPDRLFPGHLVFVLSGAMDHLRLLDRRLNAPWTNIATAIG